MFLTRLTGKEKSTGFSLINTRNGSERGGYNGVITVFFCSIVVRLEFCAGNECKMKPREKIMNDEALFWRARTEGGDGGSGEEGKGRREREGRLPEES